MDPLTIASLLAPLLGPIFFPNDAAARQRERIQALMSPESITKDTNKLYEMLLSSPAFSAALNNIISGSQNAQGQMASSLAQRGLTTSGIGSIVSGAGGSMIGSQTANLRSDTLKSALNTIMSQRQMLVPSLTNIGEGPQMNSALFSAALGALGDYMKMRVPKTTPTKPSGSVMSGVPLPQPDIFDSTSLSSSTTPTSYTNTLYGSGGYKPTTTRLRSYQPY